MKFDGGKSHLRDCGHQRGIADGVARRVDDRSVDIAVVCFVDFVDDLALDIGVENFNVDAEFGCVFSDVLIVLRQCHGAEDVKLGFAAHVHAGTV
ncbi:MAG: hypothetical protein NT123_16910 [Proteobacteria bacterium]|nr:hypothetical protein [Pseudomonadota bacterium]